MGSETSVSTSRGGVATAVLVLRHAHELRVSAVAAGMAFWLLIAVFPAGVAIVNVAGLFMPQEEVADRVGHLLQATPGSLGNVVAEQLDLVAQPSPGTGFYDALLVIIAVWSVSTATHYLIRGVRTAYSARRQSSVLVRIVAIGLSLVLLAGLGLLAWVLDSSSLVGSIVGYLALIVAVTAVITGIYWVAAGREHSYRSGVPGAVLAGLLLLVIGFGASWYFNHGGNLHVIYGATAGVIVSMLVAWLSSLALLVGAVLNACLLGNAHRRGEASAQQ